MIRHPQAADRSLFAWALLIAGIGFLAAPWFYYCFRVPLAKGDLIYLAAIYFEGAAMAVFGLLSLAGGWMLFKGPSVKPATEIKDDRKLAFVFMLAIALLLDGLCLEWWVHWQSGDYESKWGMLLVAPFLGVFALACSISVVSAFYSVFFGKGYRLILEEKIFRIGGVFDGELEIPFPVEKAPVIEATLCLMRVELISIDVTGTPEKLWSQSVTLRDWQAWDKRSSRCSFRFNTEAEKPTDYSAGSIDYYWEMQLKSADKGKTFYGELLVPIVFDNPVRERVIAG